MKLKKLMISVACIMALSACGGGGSSSDGGNQNNSGGQDSGNNNSGGNGSASGNSHDYYTINQNGKQTVSIDLTQSSGILKLSGEEIGWSVTNDALSVTGYSFLKTDEDLENDIGLILCPTNPGAYQGDAKHIVIPHSATTGSPANLQGKTFVELGDCSGEPTATFVFGSDGSLTVTEDGETETHSASEIAALFTTNGFVDTDEEGTTVTYGHIYTVGGVPLVVLNSPVEHDPWLGLLIPTDALD